MAAIRLPAYALVAIVCFLLLAPRVSVATRKQACSARTEENDADHAELLVGYKLLAHVLNQEAQLKYLRWVREIVTLHGTTKPIDRLMVKIFQTAHQRFVELKNLRKLQPDATGNGEASPIGDAIQNQAEFSSTKELILPHGEFDVRFLFVQAQATLMIAAMAKSAASFDCNAERVEWLKSVESEFEGIREELVTVMQSCKL